MTKYLSVKVFQQLWCFNNWRKKQTNINLLCSIRFFFFFLFWSQSCLINAIDGVMLIADANRSSLPRRHTGPLICRVSIQHWNSWFKSWTKRRRLWGQQAEDTWGHKHPEEKKSTTGKKRGFTKSPSHSDVRFLFLTYFCGLFGNYLHLSNKDFQTALILTLSSIGTEN